MKFKLNPPIEPLYEHKDSFSIMAPVLIVHLTSLLTIAQGPTHYFVNQHSAFDANHRG